MNLIQYLPPCWRKSDETTALVEAMQEEITKLKNAYYNYYGEIYASTAVRTIDKWEKMCGIPSVAEKELTERRSAVIARLRGGGTATADNIKRIALSYECGDIDIEEDTENYCINITFTSLLGQPKNIDEFKSVIASTVPAHLLISYTFIYNTWAYTATLTWGDAAEGSWDDLRLSQI